MKKVLLIAALAMPAATLAAQQAGDVPVVTLDDARRRAALVDPVAAAARADAGTAAWERRAARASLYTPSLSAVTNITAYSDPFFNFATGTPSSRHTNATLEARYTVIGGGKFGELRRSEAAIESAAAAEVAARFRTSFATDAAYFGVLAERELSRVVANRLRRATEQLGIARVRVQAGETIAADSLQLLLEVNRARLGVLERDSAVVVSRLRLGRQIGMSGAADAAPIDSAAPPPLPVTLEAATAELRTRGPEIEAARAHERRTIAELSSEREGYWPDVMLSGTVNAYDRDFFPTARKVSYLAVTVSLPLWDEGQREVSITRARGQRDVARVEREERERATAEQMAQAFNGYETARARLELARTGAAVSAETFRVQQVRYREGATTILDLLEAQIGLGEAEAAVVQARYAARLSLASIEALLGRRVFDGR